MSKLKKRRGISLTTKKNLHGWLYVSPFLVGILLIFIPAIALSIYYSLTDATLGIQQIDYKNIGLDAYSRAFLKDTEFRVVMYNAVTKIFLDSLIILLFSFFIATVLNQDFIGRTFARAVFFLPVILSTGLIAWVDKTNLAGIAAASNMEKEMASVIRGGSSIFSIEKLLAGVLNPDMTQTIVVAVNNISQLVNNSGVQILVFLAGLQAISPSVFEAAKIEGATKWEEFWKITFPMMAPMIVVNTIYTIIDTFIRPEYGILDFIYGAAFGNRQEFGYAAALSWIFLVIVAVILIIISLVLRKFTKKYS